MIPISPGERKLHAYVTYALIIVNVAIFAATQPRIADDHRRLEEAAWELQSLETQIWMEAHGRISFAQLFGALGETAEPSDSEWNEFWIRFEVGRILPTTDPMWQRWKKAREKLEEAERTQFFRKWGFRRNAPSPVTLFTSAFLHAGFWHIAGNMLFLWVVGTNVEEAWGRRTFIVLYVLGIVTSSLAVFFDSPITGDIPGVGASGAIACVMGAFAVRCFRKPIRMLLLPTLGVAMVPAWVFTGLWFAQQLWAFGKPGADDSGVAFGVHVFGFVVGAGMAVALKVAGAQDEIEAPQQRQIREADRNRHAAAAEERFRQKDVQGGLAALREALDAVPDDHAQRERKMTTHATLGELEYARAEGVELLERVWRGGDRRAFTAAFVKVDGLARPPLPLGLVQRAAQAFEAIDPVQAGALYVRIIQNAGNDPVLPTALRRYALLLDKVGEPDKATQVRALLAQVEARRAAAR